jgi:hypothetical protein
VRSGSKESEDERRAGFSLSRSDHEGARPQARQEAGQGRRRVLWRRKIIHNGIRSARSVGLTGTVCDAAGCCLWQMCRRSLHRRPAGHVLQGICGVQAVRTTDCESAPRPNAASRTAPYSRMHGRSPAGGSEVVKPNYKRIVDTQQPHTHTTSLLHAVARLSFQPGSADDLGESRFPPASRSSSDSSLSRRSLSSSTAPGSRRLRRARRNRESSLPGVLSDDEEDGGGPADIRPRIVDCHRMSKMSRE